MISRNSSEVSHSSQDIVHARARRLSRYHVYASKAPSNSTSLLYYTAIAIGGLYLTIGLAPLYLDCSIFNHSFDDPSFSDSSDRVCRAVYDESSRKWLATDDTESMSSILISENLL